MANYNALMIDLIVFFGIMFFIVLCIGVVVGCIARQIGKARREMQRANERIDVYNRLYMDDYKPFDDTII